MEKVIVFQLNDKEYALPVTQVLAIEKLQHITRVPLTAPFILGVMNLRGIIIPVIDLKKRFGMEDDTDADKEERKLIIVRFGEIETGLLVDEATDVLDIDEKSGTRAGSGKRGQRGLYFRCGEYKPEAFAAA